MTVLRQYRQPRQLAAGRTGTGAGRDNSPQGAGQGGSNRLCSVAVTPPQAPAGTRSLLVDLAIVLALALIAVVGYKFSPLLLPKADLTVSPAPGCDLHRQTCHADLPDGGRIELSMTPRPVPVLKPFRVEASLSGVNAARVEIDFAGATMNMGYNRQPLAPATPAAPGRFAGEATLPVCVTGRMSWVATLMVETDRQRIAVPFRFDAPIDGA